MRNRPYPKTKRTNAFRAKRKTKLRSLFDEFYGIRDKGDPYTLDRVSSGRYSCDIDKKALFIYDFIGMNEETGLPMAKIIIDKYLH